MPDLKFDEPAVKDSVIAECSSVHKTGVRSYRLVAPKAKNKKTDLLFVQVAKDFDSGGNGSPVGVLVHSKKKRLSLATGAWDTIQKFKKGKVAILLVTDADYDFQDETLTPFCVEAFPPVIKVKKVEVDSPIAPGGQSQITITYDLLCVPGQIFGVSLVTEVKGPKPFFTQTINNSDWAAGTDKEFQTQWNAPNPGKGNYKFKFFARTPGDAFGGEHVKGTGKAKVKVK